MASRATFQCIVSSYHTDEVCTRIFDQHRKRVHALCLWMLGEKDSADRLTQMVFIGCLRQLQPGVQASDVEEQIDRFLVFHLRAAVQELPRRHGPSPLGRDRPRNRGPFLRSVSDGRLVSAIQAVAPIERLILLLHDWQGYAMERIADLMGAEATVCRQRLLTARLQLRTALLRDGAHNHAILSFPVLT